MVWDVKFDDVGRHPAIVLSINPLNGRLGHVAVIAVTGTRGPEQTHVPLTADAGLTRYERVLRRRHRPATGRQEPPADAPGNTHES